MKVGYWPLSVCLYGDLCVALTACVGVNDYLALRDADVQGAVAMETKCDSQWWGDPQGADEMSTSQCVQSCIWNFCEASSSNERVQCDHMM